MGLIAYNKGRSGINNALDYSIFADHSCNLDLIESRYEQGKNEIVRFA